MKFQISTKAIAACLLSLVAFTAQAGNKDRTGQAGAAELLINPWGRSTGVFGQDAAHTTGIEAMRINIAGLAGAGKTEVGVSYNRFFSSADIGAMNAGMAFKAGANGTFGVNMFSMNYGEITTRTVQDPAGVGTYRPQFLNISVGYAKEFSNNIRAGLSATLINEQISNVKAMGATFDAGVQYTTGPRDAFHFGVALRNVGTNMKFDGEGFSYNAEAQNNSLFTNSVRIPTEGFQMPTSLQLATSYDFYLDGNKYQIDSTELPKHRLTPMVSFTSNSFLNDYLGGGVEYAYREAFMLRAAYRYEKDITENSFYTGVSAGASVGFNFGRDREESEEQKAYKAPRMMFDYSFRPTQRPANGVHAFSVRFMLR